METDQVEQLNVLLSQDAMVLKHMPQLLQKEIIGTHHLLIIKTPR